MAAGSLAGRVALVTGAGRGIGRAIADKLAVEGAHLVVNDLDPDELAATVTGVIEQGGKAIGCPGDVTRPSFGEEFVQAALASFGSVDIIVNNAGYTWDAVIQKMTDDQWQAMLDVHVTAPFRILRAAAPWLREQARRDQADGREVFRKVVNISSASGLGGNPGQANYAAAKSGINGLTKTLAKEWGRYRVNVNSVAFGLIRTRLTEAPSNDDGTINVDDKRIKVGVSAERFAAFEQSIPLGRGATPDEAAGAVYLLCTPESDYITGHVLLCTGGIPM
jgi:3-oxoacyl-[acyl-carrier protein] reductase